jgi:hypothetical protein
MRAMPDGARPRAPVLSARERATLSAAFAAGNAAATEAETAAFVAWVAQVRVEGAMVALILGGLALPVRPEGGSGYRLRAIP